MMTVQFRDRGAGKSPRYISTDSRFIIYEPEDASDPFGSFVLAEETGDGYNAEFHVPSLEFARSMANKLAG